ncbi:hypothetical protein RHMOL_Rhmol06G0039900 [Rhododendron molle]|uniref:Uncharacterized protein n=1 Tax=Rhododendron molle TaxID=49168 RepID=A0ACC0NA75_RHOML|nr:hypothetical protein RHMOL_Rhmol06G0039900 [Rhododendron molle]
MMSCARLPSFINWACQLFSTVPHMNFLFVIILTVLVIILSRQGTDSNIAAEMVQGRMQSDAIGDHHEHRSVPAGRIPSETVVVSGDDERPATTTSVDDVDSRAEALIANQKEVWLAEIEKEQESYRTVQRRYRSVSTTGHVLGIVLARDVRG